MSNNFLSPGQGGSKGKEVSGRCCKIWLRKAFAGGMGVRSLRWRRRTGWEHRATATCRGVSGPASIVGTIGTFVGKAHIPPHSFEVVPLKCRYRPFCRHVEGSHIKASSDFHRSKHGLIAWCSQGAEGHCLSQCTVLTGMGTVEEGRGAGMSIHNATSLSNLSFDLSTEEISAR